MNLVKCRYCGKRFDKDSEPYEVGHGQGLGGDRFYYHKDCFQKALVEPKNQWIINKDKEDDFKKNCDYMYDYLSFYLKVPADYAKIMRQARNFMNGNNSQNIHCKPQGMFLALQYAYDVKKLNPDRGEGGIGIVPYVYKEAFDYWEGKARRDAHIIEKIYQQMDELRKSEEKSAPVVHRNRKKKSKIKTYDLKDLASEREE